MIHELFVSYTVLDDSLFSSTISIPGIPIAGDNFIITCIVTGPDRLVITPQLDWEVKINGMILVLVAEAEADIGIVTIGDTIITGNANFQEFWVLLQLGLRKLDNMRAVSLFRGVYLNLSLWTFI